MHEQFSFLTSLYPVRQCFSYFLDFWFIKTKHAFSSTTFFFLYPFNDRLNGSTSYWHPSAHYPSLKLSIFLSVIASYKHTMTFYNSFHFIYPWITVAIPTSHPNSCPFFNVSTSSLSAIASYKYKMTIFYLLLSFDPFLSITASPVYFLASVSLSFAII